MSSEHHILLVDDNHDDVGLIQRALQKCEARFPMHIVGDGEAACRYIHGDAPYADRHAHPVPTLILLDLKLPRRNGFDVLRYVRAHPLHAQLIVVVLTSSREPEDVERAYRAGANSYLVKPIKPDDMNRMFAALNLYWLQSNIPPSARSATAGHADSGHR